MYLLWKAIHSFVNEADSSYVIDIAYLKQSNKFMLVELSPFTPCTGPALFHWQQDKSVLQYGKKGITITNDMAPDDSNNTASITATATEQTPFTTHDPTVLSNPDLTPHDLIAIQNIVFRLKQEKDVHPQLGELVEVNWDLRWKEDKTPYHEYYTQAREDRKRSEKLALTSESETNESSTEKERWTDRVKRWFGGGGGGGKNISQQQQKAVESEPPNSLEAPPPAADLLSAKSEPDWNLHPDIKANLTTSQPASDETAQLFVYGTLKNGFQWNGKYLHPRLGAQFVSSAVTCGEFALVVGNSGVPYLLGDVVSSGDGGGGGGGGGG
eukprot:gene33565-41420_t